MTKHTHTPRPWKVDERTGITVVYNGERNTCLMGGEDNIICTFHGKQVKRDDGALVWQMDERDVANARLMAAAPDLLEACIEVENFARYADDFDSGLYDEVIAAIAKARGEDS